MADSIWGTARRLDESLFNYGQQFDFFQAVRLLLLQEGPEGVARPSRDGDRIRFAVEATLAFPASSIVRIERDARSGVPLVTTAFLGLLGPSGVLPDIYTETAINQKYAGNESYAAFFDLFHHRLLWLFYRAWEKHHFVTGYEQAFRKPGTKDALTSYLLDFIGMGTPALSDRLPLRDVSLLRYAGLLAQRPHSAECLRALLQDFFGVTVTVEQFIGRWHALEADECCELGLGETNSQLGMGTVAGDAVWTRQAMIRIDFGPLTAEQFFRFLPDGRDFDAAAGLTRWFLGQALDFELRPVLAAGQSPTWGCLCDPASGGPRLGWSSWLTQESFAHAASDAVFAEDEKRVTGGCPCH